MGCISDCFGRKESEDKKKSPKAPTPARDVSTEKTESAKTINLNIDDTPADTEKPIPEAKLNEEVRKSIKYVTESAYGSSKSRERPTDLADRDLRDLRLIKRWAARHHMELLCLCGSGQYADVYRVYQKKKDKDFAVKVINVSKIGNNYKQNFLPNELKILKKMPKHQNIIKVYYLEERKDKIFIIMEFAHNGTLTDWLKDKGAMTEQLAQFMFPKILNGVYELHSRSIAHRDLKLENILLSKQFNPKISDFSYALEVDPNNPLSTQYCGSLPYFAPEMLQRTPYNPLLSDSWSLGVCFYILLNDKLPFKLGDDSLMLENQLNKNWSFRTKIDKLIGPELKHVVSSLLEPNTELRATTEALKSNPWFIEHDKN